MAENTRDVVFSTATYDVEVHKLCSSCSTLVSWYIARNASFPNDFLSYCNATDYGYSSEQSMLAFFPLDPATGNLLTGTKLRVFLGMHASRASLDTAPTAAWPRGPDVPGLVEVLPNETAAVAGQFNESALLDALDLSQFIPSLFAASSGSIGLMPDYQGYGESTLNRTTFSKDGYVQSSVVAFFGMSKHLSIHYPCTLLDNAPTIQGEDGTFGAIFAAHAFRRFNLRVLKIFSASGILDVDTMLSHYIQHVDAGADLHAHMQSLLDLTVFSYSVGTPYLANTGSGADLVSDGARVDVLNHLGPETSMVDAGNPLYTCSNGA